MGNSGYVYLLRSVRDTWVRKHRPGEWMDFLMLAACSDRTIMFSGHPVRVRRGQYATTYRSLADKLNMPLSSVKLFLDRAEEDGMITRQPIRLPGRSRTHHRTPDGTLITIINYDPNQYLRGSENSSRNADPNAGQHIEEVSDKKKAAAAVQCVCELPAGNGTATSRDSGASGIPPELGGIFDLLRGITQVDVDWPADQISEMIELASKVGWPAVREHVERIATREVKRGSPPKSLRYYIKAIGEDEAAKPRSDAQACVAGLTRGIGGGGRAKSRGRPCSHEPFQPNEPDEPELGQGFEEFKEFGRRLVAGAERGTPHPRS